MPAQISQPFSDFTLMEEKPIKMEQQSIMNDDIQHSIAIERQIMINNIQQQPTSTITAFNYDIKDPEIQKAMVQQFSAISGMKVEWSEKCLKDMKWDFEVRFFNYFRRNYFIKQKGQLFL